MFQSRLSAPARCRPDRAEACLAWQVRGVGPAGANSRAAASGGRYPTCAEFPALTPGGPRFEPRARRGIKGLVEQVEQDRLGAGEAGKTDEPGHDGA